MLDPHRKDLVAKVVELARAGDPQALRMVLERIDPTPRAMLPAIEIPGLTECVSMSEKARCIVDAAGRGTISPDAASALLGAIANAARIVEHEELSERISRLETAGLI